MSVYLVEATKASCRVSGCGCHERGPRYPSDATDAEWELLRPQAQAVMVELRRGPGGRPMEHDLRAMLDAIGYVTRYGIEWRALPVNFPPWEGRVCLLRAVERAGSAAGTARPAAWAAAGGVRPRRVTHGRVD
jgi:transposase